MTRSIYPKKLRRLSIMFAMTAIGLGASGLASPAGAGTTCIKAPCGGVQTSGQTNPGKSDEFPTEPPLFSGSFRISYSPIQCFKAPCPPGFYSIRSNDGGGLSKRAHRIVLRNAETGEIETFRGRYIRGHWLSAEGQVWIEDNVGYVSVDRVLDED